MSAATLGRGSTKWAQMEQFETDGCSLESRAQKRLRGRGWWFESRTKGATGSASGQSLNRAGEYNRDDQVLGK